MEEKPNVQAVLGTFLAEFFAEDEILACCDGTTYVYGGFLRRATEHILDKGKVTKTDMHKYLYEEGGDLDLRTTKFQKKKLPKEASYHKVELLYNNRRRDHCNSYMIWLPDAECEKFIRYEVGVYDHKVDRDWNKDYTVNSLVWSKSSSRVWFRDVRCMEDIEQRILRPFFDDIGRVGMKKLWRGRRLWQQGYRPKNPAQLLKVICTVLEDGVEYYTRDTYPNDCQVWVSDLSSPLEASDFKTQEMTIETLRDDAVFQEMFAFAVKNLFK